MRDDIKKRFVLGVIFGTVLLTGCGNKKEEVQPNFVVQKVQTAVRNTPSAAEETQGTDTEDTDAKDTEKTDIDTKENAVLETEGSEQEPPLSNNSFSTVQEDVAELQNNNEVTQMTAEDYRQLTAMTVVYPQNFTQEELDSCFYFEEISEAVFARMEGKSYGADCTTPLDDLRYVRVLHHGFDGAVHIGELVVNRAIAQDIVDIFRELYDADYLIEKMVLIDAYDADDDASMAGNNTSSFNFRLVEGTDHLSRHAYGLAIDINPLYNPYLPERDGVITILPENAGEYVDRTTGCPYYIMQGDICYEAFISRGFTWGGDWSDSKDYQHFSKVVN